MKLCIPRKDWPWIAAYIVLYGATFGPAVVAAARSAEDVFFTYTANGTAGGEPVAILRPMIMHDWAVALDSGNRQIQRGDYLRCKPQSRVQKFVAKDGVEVKVTELLLHCKNPDRVLVVKGPVFPE